MKKISLVAFGCLAVASVMAQNGTTTAGNKDYKPLRTPMTKATRFGLAAGVNLAKFAMEDVPASMSVSTTMKTSMYGGAFINFPIGGILRLQPGVFYNGLGSKISNSVVGATTRSYEQDLHYISVPLTLQIVPGNTGFFLEFGPQIGYLFTGKREETTAGSNGDNMFNKSDYDRTDFAVHGGIGYITRIGFGVEAKYYNGFTNVYKDEGSVSASGQEARNRAWQFGLFYHFGAAK
ncbi:MAG: PorT family protein [Sphingobacteriales bacterium]|nr:MAG: PorT family protein [Sphingobacteriales bacterium]